MSAGLVLLVALGTSDVSPDAAAPGPREYLGELEVYLEPWDPRELCAVTVGLRNLAGVRQGEAWLKLRWVDTDNTVVGEPDLRLDGLLPERFNAKNLTLPVRCSRLSHVEVVSAEWTLPHDAVIPGETRVPITGVAGTRWRFAWNGEIALFKGTPE
jgi:hypothetical protein